MKFSALSAVAAFALSVAAQVVDPSINTPVGVTQCATTSLTFSGTHPPFVISVIPGGQAGAPVIEDIVTTSTSPYAWLCNLSQGTYITFQIRDSIGALQYSAPISVANSSNSSCTSVTPTAPTVSATGVVTPTLSVGSSSGISSPTGGASGTGSSTPPSASHTTTGGSSSPSASAPTPSTTAKSSAFIIHAQWGIAGLLGLFGAAVLA